ncbi:hypothetical protein BDZ90DRAFT_133369 [Jaminaea rosea]|uniref:Uncharacterized protein n=1 Tax=Jaminaea rosea TaxID=1569628 RepID=A0A316UV40_9BASI|nr:hypothetical protein BDZ90DRAFT_133369 [Jaminaea rosea]PWN28874.1 hypothetical protein BDZ90DRAFT_133369 [Jaminaea rosea]
MMMLSLPLAVASGFVLYKRLYLGEEQRHLHPGDRIASKPASTHREPTSPPPPRPSSGPSQ